MLNTRTVWTSAIWSVIMAGLLTAPSLADDAVMLTRTAKVGDSIPVTSTIVVGANDITVVWNRKLAVKELKENGDAVVTDTLLGGKYTVNGTDNDIPAGAPTTITANKYAKIVTFTPANDDNPYLAASTFHLLALVETVIFPDKPVKPGDTWTTEVDNPAMKDKKVAIKTTFVGTDKADGKDVWKVKQSLEADTDGGKLTADTTATLDAGNGQLLQADMDIKGVPVKIGNPTDWKVKLVRTKPEEKKAVR